MHTKRSPKEVIRFAEEAGAKLVDMKFIDFPGMWNHWTYPMHQLDESIFEEGFGFDGSSIRGWQSIDSSDMLMVPDPNTALIDPFCDDTTLAEEEYDGVDLTECGLEAYPEFTNAGIH